MPVDPHYARSNLKGGQNTVLSDDTVSSDSMPAEAAPKQTAQSEGSMTEPGAASTNEGSSAAAPAEPTVASGVETKPPGGEPAPEASQTPEPTTDEVTQAQELLKLVKDNPAEFAKRHGIDLAPRFAKLGQMASDIRRREQELEAGAAKVKEAEEVLTLLERDQVGFVEKFLGEDGMSRLNRAALAKDDPLFANINRLENLIAEQSRKLEELTGKPQEAASLPPEQAAEAEAYFTHSAQEFRKDHDTLSAQAENKKLIDFYGEEEMRTDAAKLAINTYKAVGKMLTAEETWGMLRAEFASRLEKINGGGTAETPTQQSSEPSSQSNGSTTLQASLQQSAARVEPPVELDFSAKADRKRMAEMATRYSGK